VWSNRPMDRISAWIDEKPYRFRLILLGHTAVFTCAILIAAGLFRNPPSTPPRDYAERTLVDAHGFAAQPATSRTTRTETADPNRGGGVSVATFRDRVGSSWATLGASQPSLARCLRLVEANRYFAVRRATAGACYSITSSARSRMDGGMARPSAVAVLRFTTISNLVGNCTGRSPAFSLRRMRST